MSTSETKFALHSRRVLLPSGMKEATVVVRGKKIAEILPGPPQPDLFDSATTGFFFGDIGDRVIMPGLIDPHVHINEPGRTDWEGFDTATRAAAAGGVTTLVDMPLNSSPVTTTVENFQRKLEATKGKLHVNCGFYGGIIPGNADHLVPLAEAGCTRV